MKKMMIVALMTSFVLAGCFGQGSEQNTETDMAKKLGKTMESFAIEKQVETETEFGTQKEIVFELKEEIGPKEEEKIAEYSNTFVEYGEVATAAQEFHEYLMVMAMIKDKYPGLLTDNEWQNLQEQWQELNDPID